MPNFHPEVRGTHADAGASWCGMHVWTRTNDEHRTTGTSTSRSAAELAADPAAMSHGALPERAEAYVPMAEGAADALLWPGDAMVGIRASEPQVHDEARQHA
jgi:hypothetical protein